MLIVAQLWKQNGDRLENKNGVWMYMEETWILPNENTTNEDQVGELVRKTISKAVGVFKTYFFSDSQQWKIHDNVLQNKEGLWMSAEKWNFTTITGELVINNKVKR